MLRVLVPSAEKLSRMLLVIPLPRPTMTMTKSMRDSFSALGTNTLSIQVWGYGSRTVPVDDMYDICQRHSDLIKAVSPQIEFSGNASGTLKIGTTSYRWSNISGVDENYTEMKNYQIAQGRGLQYMDMQDNIYILQEKLF